MYRPNSEEIYSPSFFREVKSNRSSTDSAKASFMARIKTLGAAQALLLLAALLSTGVCADKVTWDRCKEYPDYGERFVTRDDPVDTEAVTLEIKNCQITDVNVGDLDGMPNLRHIWMNDNKISKLDAAVFSGVNQLAYLFLNNNSLSSVPVFGKAGVLPNLQVLNLALNQIRKLGNPETFSSMKELRTLNLHRNLIDHINPAVFQGLPHLETIYLSHNKLKYISDRMFAIPSLSMIDLEKNYVEFVSPGAFLGASIESLSLNDNKLRYLPDRFVSGIAAGGKLKYFYIQNNPLQCPCLSEVLAEVRQVDGCDYASQLYTDETRMCEQTNDSECRRMTETEYLQGKS